MAEQPGSETFDQNNLQDANPQGTSNAAPNPPAPTGPGIYPTFPYPNSRRRLGDYDYFMHLFMGEHFEAFNIKVADEKFSREYSKLRYVLINMAGLISKVCADMLFSEPPTFYTETGSDADQAFLDALVRENNLHVQNYESALSNSALGDAVYKVRLGERNEGDNKPTIIIDDFTPSIYFPQVNGFNVREEPSVKELAWTFFKGEDKYLRKEIHTRGQIENQVWSMKDDQIITKQNISILGDPDLTDFEETKIDDSLIVHIPNWKTGNRYFGISDYNDLDKLFFLLNNRMTKIDNILDKHGDPILRVPKGVLNEDGSVSKKNLGVIEIGEGEDGKLEYVVWDASLDSAFKEISQALDFLFMTAEVSPDVFGMGKGTNDSGKALKYKLLRTIAKVARKKLYYDKALKKVLYTAMEMAKAHNVKVAGLTPVEPFYPEIEWQDGLPMDMTEAVAIEKERLDAGNTTVVDSIMRLDGVDEKTAKKKAADIKKDTAIPLPTSQMGTTGFGPNDPRNKMSGNGVVNDKNVGSNSNTATAGK